MDQHKKIRVFQVVFDIGGMGLVGFNVSLENEEDAKKHLSFLMDT